MTREIEELRRSLDAAIEQVVEAHMRLDDQRRVSTNLSLELEEAKAAAATLREALTKASEVELQLAEARIALDQEQRKCAVQETELAGLWEDLKNSRRALADTQSELGDAQTFGSIAEARFDALRATLRTAREEAADLRVALAGAQHAQTEMKELGEIETLRRAVQFDLLTSAGLPLGSQGLLGSLLRRYSRGAMADAIRDIEVSGLFDSKWYAEQYPDAVKNWHPATHYLLHGGYSGFNPGPNFDSDAYLAVNPDVRAVGANPLLHFVRWGARELRRRNPISRESPTLAPLDGVAKLWQRPSAPPMSRFYELRKSRLCESRPEPPLVDVIVPVYRSYDDTLACLESVLVSKNKTPFELIVIDDHSPEPEVSVALEEIARLGLITLIKNERNLGFVGTVNRGMALNPERDVLLLNSDTLVFNDWLDRLRFHGELGKIATVTPFTTNGTICSYPKFCQDNNEAPDRSFGELDELFRTLNSGRNVEIPTGVGFCMYITRSALNQLGLFDEEAFGKGYGEENDFCMRAKKDGWRNLHALDVFVFHSGETSFADAAQEGKRRGLAAVHQKHPDYPQIVQAFVDRDPARAARMTIDAVRLLGHVPKKSTLCFSHTSGGGIERYLKDHSARQQALGRDVLLFVPSIQGSSTGRLTTVGAEIGSPNLDNIDLVRDVEPLRSVLQDLGVDRIEVHSTVGWSYKFPMLIERLAQVCGLEYSVMLHDYVAICPRINLINESGAYCGEEGVAQCVKCISNMTARPHAVHPDIPDPTQLNIVGWRRMYGRLLHQAASVTAPSLDAAKRFSRYFPELAVEVAPHRENLAHIRPAAVPISGDLRLRVGVLGAIGPHKGSQVLLACAKNAEDRGLPIEFVVIGYTDINSELQQLRVAITGPYDEREIGDILADQRLNIVFLPSIWPETFCYTLSIAIAAEIPVCIFDFGAPAERLTEHTSLRLPLHMMRNPREINDQLILFAERLSDSHRTSEAST